MRRMTYLIASSKFGGDGNLNNPNVTGITSSGPNMLIEVRAERAEQAERIEGSYMA